MNKYEERRMKVVKALLASNQAYFTGWEVSESEREPARDVHYEVGLLLEAYEKGCVDLDAIKKSLVENERHKKEGASIAAG